MTTWALRVLETKSKKWPHVLNANCHTHLATKSQQIVIAISFPLCIQPAPHFLAKLQNGKWELSSAKQDYRVYALAPAAVPSSLLARLPLVAFSDAEPHQKLNLATINSMHYLINMEPIRRRWSSAPLKSCTMESEILFHSILPKVVYFRHCIPLDLYFLWLRREHSMSDCHL